MPNPLLTKIVAKHKRAEVPECRPGDTIRVHVKIREGDKERLQAFEGTVIARKNSGLGETVTVRKVSFGHGVERIFPIHAPVVDHIDVVRTGRVRRWADWKIVDGNWCIAKRRMTAGPRARSPCI